MEGVTVCQKTVNIMDPLSRPILHAASSTPPSSPLPLMLLFYSSLYPLCLPFLIFVSFYIPEQIEVENKKKREQIGEERIRE
jgi:hypothetical protein